MSAYYSNSSQSRSHASFSPTASTHRTSPDSRTTHHQSLPNGGSGGNGNTVYDQYQAGSSSTSGGAGGGNSNRTSNVAFLNKRIQTLEEQVERSQREHESEVERLQTQLINSRKDADLLVRDCNDRLDDQDIKTHYGSQQLQQTIEGLQETVRQRESEIAAERNSKEELKTHLEQIIRSLVENNKKNQHSFKEKEAEDRRKIDALLTEHDATLNELKEFQGKMGEFEQVNLATMSEKQAEISALKSEMSNKHTITEEFMRDLTVAQRTIKELEAQHKQDTKKLELVSDEQGGRIASLVEENEEIYNKLLKANEHLDQLAQQLTETNVQWVRTKGINTSLQEELGAVQTAKTEMEQEYQQKMQNVLLEQLQRERQQQQERESAEQQKKEKKKKKRQQEQEKRKAQLMQLQQQQHRNTTHNNGLNTDGTADSSNGIVVSDIMPPSGGSLNVFLKQKLNPLVRSMCYTCDGISTQLAQCTRSVDDYVALVQGGDGGGGGGGGGVSADASNQNDEKSSKIWPQYLENQLLMMDSHHHRESGRRKMKMSRRQQQRGGNANSATSDEEDGDDDSDLDHLEDMDDDDLDGDGGQIVDEWEYLLMTALVRLDATLSVNREECREIQDALASQRLLNSSSAVTNVLNLNGNGSSNSHKNNNSNIAEHHNNGVGQQQQQAQAHQAQTQQEHKQQMADERAHIMRLAAEVGEKDALIENLKGDLRRMEHTAMEQSNFMAEAVRLAEERSGRYEQLASDKENAEKQLEFYVNELSNVKAAMVEQKGKMEGLKMELEEAHAARKAALLSTEKSDEKYLIALKHTESERLKVKSLSEKFHEAERAAQERQEALLTTGANERYLQVQFEELNSTVGRKDEEITELTQSVRRLEDELYTLQRKVTEQRMAVAAQSTVSSAVSGMRFDHRSGSVHHANASRAGAAGGGGNGPTSTSKYRRSESMASSAGTSTPPSKFHHLFQDGSSATHTQLFGSSSPAAAAAGGGGGRGDRSSSKQQQHHQYKNSPTPMKTPTGTASSCSYIDQNIENMSQNPLLFSTIHPAAAAAGDAMSSSSPMPKLGGGATGSEIMIAEGVSSALYQMTTEQQKQQQHNNGHVAAATTTAAADKGGKSSTSTAHIDPRDRRNRLDQWENRINAMLSRSDV